jgi:apurinic endonuclease APN1
MEIQYELKIIEEYNWECLIQGCHVGKRASYFQTLFNFTDSSLRCFQFYVSNSRSYDVPFLSTYEIKDTILAKEFAKKMNYKLFIHSSLIINLCGSVDPHSDPSYKFKMGKSRSVLIGELDIGVLLGCGNVTHIGTCKDKVLGLQNIIESVEYCLTRESNMTSTYAKFLGISPEDFMKRRRIILENSSDSKNGNKMGAKLKEIGKIIDGVRDDLRKQITICIDTAHLHGAGDYNLSQIADIDTFYEEFEKYIGIEKLEVFHFNDSKAAFNSKLDRHTHIGNGVIWNSKFTKALLYFMEKSIDHEIPLIGEPPKEESYKESLDYIKKVFS